MFAKNSIKFWNIFAKIAKFPIKIVNRLKISLLLKKLFEIYSGIRRPPDPQPGEGLPSPPLVDLPFPPEKFQGTNEYFLFKSRRKTTI